MANPSQSQDQEPDISELQNHQSSPIETPNTIGAENSTQNDVQTLELSKNQDPERSDPNNEEDDDEEEEFSGTHHVLIRSSSTPTISKSRKKAVTKRKKAVGFKKQQAIDKKVQNLLELGTFVSFMPSKALDFYKYEALFKSLGLWDFVHIEFDDSIRANLIGQFIVSYDASKGCCFVNGSRVMISRSLFARTLKLPVGSKKKYKAVGSVAEAAIDVELVCEKESEECILFMEDFVENWMLLHGEDWTMPKEIGVWMSSIRNGHPEEVDWGTMLWMMVQNELKQKDQLRTCFYTSHLLYFMKSTCQKLFNKEVENVVINEEIEEGKSLSEADKQQVIAEDVKKDEDLLKQPQKMDEKERVDVGDLLEQPQKMDEKERVDVGDLEVEELKGQPFEVVEEPNEGSYEVAEELNEGPHEVVEEVKSRLLEVEGVKQDAVSSFLGMSKEQDVVILGEPSIELTLGQQDIVKKEEIKFDSPRAVEECTDTKNNHGCFSGSDNGSKQLLQPCTFGVGKEAVKQLEMEGEDYTKEVDYMNAVEHIKEWEHMEEGEQMETDNVEEVEGDEMREQLEVNDEEDVEGNEMGEHFELEDEEELERDELEGQLEVEDEEEEEPNDEIECNIAPNYGPLEGADLTGDLLQGFETGQMPMNLQGQQLHESSSMELFASNAETHLIMGGPSMYGNGHKRANDYEHDTSHHMGNKRIRTDIDWDQKTSDIGFCISQAQQLMEKARIMHEEKEQYYNEANMNQQYLMRQLQQRDSIIEELGRNKNEELQKKDREIYRLERELGLLGELVNGYREALKENRKLFLEYRQRIQLPEEPIYKDAGPGGLVMSITELEKQRQKQENEDRLKRLMIMQKFNEALQVYENQFEVLLSKVQMIDMDRLIPLENEVKLLKELYAARAELQKKADCVPTDTTLPSEQPADTITLSSEQPADITLPRSSEQPADLPLPLPLPSEQPADVPLALPSEQPADVPLPLPSEQPADVPLPLPSEQPADVPLPLPSEQPADVPLPSEQPADAPLPSAP